MFHELSRSPMASTQSSVLLDSATSAPLEVQDISISSTAEKARRLLLCCQEFQDEEPKRMAGVQFSRFNLWTSNIGVFSSQHASLDYRLRTAPMVKMAIEGNLEILCQHLLLALKACTDLLDEDSDTFSDLSGVELSRYGSKLLRDSPPDSNARIMALSTIESTISTLHSLSLAIRRASNRNALAKVPKLLDGDIGYTIVRLVQTDLSLLQSSVDPIQFEIATGFEEFLRRVLKSRWFRSDPETTLDIHQEEYRELLFRRCITSISSRRRQLSYFQSHQAKLAMPRQIKTMAPVQKLAKSTDNARSLSNTERLTVQRPSINRFLDTPRSETAATDLDVPAFRASPSTAAPSSAASASEVGGLGTAGTFEVPPAPQIHKGEKEKMCPYCCLVFPDQLFSAHKKSRKWKKHLLEDMQPYICIFKNCDQAGKSYRSFKEWQAHLNKPHDQDWVCPLSHPHIDTTEVQTFIFGTIEEFQTHLEAAHPDLEASSTHNIFRVASQPAALPQWCFVCLAEQTSDIALQRHVANHLESAFLLALPGRDDIEESYEASMGKPSTGTTGSVTAQPFEADLPDLSDLYSDNSDGITAEATQNMSSNDFATQLSSLNSMSTSLEERVGLLYGRSSDSDSPSSQNRTPVPQHRRPHDRTDLLEAPRLSQSWRALITVIMFLVHVRKEARISQEMRDSESLPEITWEDIYRIASECVKRKRWTEAEGWAWYIADAFEKYEGDEHPCTLMSLANLASVFAFQGRWIEADDLGYRVMRRRKKVLGVKHPDTLTAMHNLASTYENRGKWEEAEGLLIRVVEGRKEVLGEFHLATTTSILSLALTHVSQGQRHLATLFLNLIFDRYTSKVVPRGPLDQELLDRAITLRRVIQRQRWNLVRDPYIRGSLRARMEPLVPPPPQSQRPPLHLPSSSSGTDGESAYVDIPLNPTPVSEYPFARKHSIMRESNWHADSTDIQIGMENVEQDDTGPKDDIKKEDEVEEEDDAEKVDDSEQEDDGWSLLGMLEWEANLMQKKLALASCSEGPGNESHRL